MAIIEKTVKFKDDGEQTVKVSLNTGTGTVDCDSGCRGAFGHGWEGVRKCSAVDSSGRDEAERAVTYMHKLPRCVHQSGGTH